MAVSINKKCSAEFDIFLFIIFKRNIELLFWRMVFNPLLRFPCVYTIVTEVTELGRKKNPRIEVEVML